MPDIHTWIHHAFVLTELSAHCTVSTYTYYIPSKTYFISIYHKRYSWFPASSVTFLMLCWTHILCWSSSFSLWSRTASSAFSIAMRSGASTDVHDRFAPLCCETEHKTLHSTVLQHVKTHYYCCLRSGKPLCYSYLQQSSAVQGLVVSRMTFLHCKLSPPMPSLLPPTRALCMSWCCLAKLHMCSSSYSCLWHCTFDNFFLQTGTQ